jgi:hypothetical protein
VSGHDEQCPLRHLSMLKSGCPQCDLIAAGRRAERASIAGRIRAEFPKPTLGVQRILRMVEEQP